MRVNNFYFNKFLILICFGYFDFFLHFDYLWFDFYSFIFILDTVPVSVWAAYPLLDYPEWVERGMGIDCGDYMTCLPHLVHLSLVIHP
jgi:hypothetical protein